MNSLTNLKVLTTILLKETKKHHISLFKDVTSTINKDRIYYSAILLLSNFCFTVGNASKLV